MHARYSFKLNWIDYLANTGSMKHKQDLFTSLQLDLIIITKLIITKINIPNAQHVTIKISGLIILILLNNRYLLRFYNKRIELNLKLSCRLLIGQNIVIVNKTLNFEQY